MRPAARLITAVCVVAAFAGCRRREPPEVAKRRAAARYLQDQVASLETLVAQAERGELGIQDEIAIAVSEEVINDLLAAALPQEVVLGGRLRLRLESGQALFRGNRAALLLRAALSSTAVSDARAAVELGGILEHFEVTEGRLLARVSVAHLSVLEAPGGELAADVIENLVKQNLGAIDEAIPALVVPVGLEQEVRVNGLNEGPVAAGPGVLPLAFEVGHVIPSKERLWVLLKAKVGPWQAVASEVEP